MKRLICIALLFLVSACGGEIPLPTPLDPEQARRDAGLPSETELAQTQTALAPTITYTPSQTDTPTETYTPAFTATDTPTTTATLSSIQQTEVALFLRLTKSPTQTPLPSDTPTETPSHTPSTTFTPSQTALPTLEIPNRVFPNQIIFSSTRAGSRDIWRMNLDGSDPSPVVILPDSEELSASCSSDGRQMVFDSTQGGDREIYLLDFETAEIRPLTDTDGENYQPVWAQNEIAFISTREGGNPTLWLMDTGGGNLRKITPDGANDSDPHWSPDGERLFFVRNGDIFAYDLSSNTLLQVTDSLDRQEAAPTLGYDLQTLAFIANRENDSRSALWVDRGEGFRPIVTAEGRVDHPAWIDNDRILVAADLGGVTQILLVDLQQTRQSILTNVGPENYYPRPCWVAQLENSRQLPQGEFITPTPTPAPELSSVYTAIVNPLEDWVVAEKAFSFADLQNIAPDDYRLGAAQLELSAGLLVYIWEGADGVGRLVLQMRERDGALEVEIINYTQNALPADLQAVADIPFILRENLLRGSISPEFYNLQALALDENGLEMVFRLPPP